MASNSTGDGFQSQDLKRLKKLLHEILESPCWKELSSVNGTKKQSKQSSEEDSMAVVYIIVVLIIFGMSLLILLIKYLKKEKESSKLQQFYEEYLERRLPSLVVHYDEEGHYLRPKPNRKLSARRPELNLDLPSPSASSTCGTPLTTPSVTVVTPDGASFASDAPILKRDLFGDDV